MIEAKPEEVGSGHGHRHQRHAQAFSAEAWGPLTGTTINPYNLFLLPPRPCLLMRCRVARLPYMMFRCQICRLM